MSKRTPTPWKLAGRSEHDNTLLINSTHAISEVKQQDIARVCPAPFYADNQEANAAFIVRAVNAYETLITSIKYALDTLHKVNSCLAPTDYDATAISVRVSIKDLEQALALAEGGEK